MAGGRALLGQVADQVAGRPLVQAGRAGAFDRRRWLAGAQLADEGTDRPAQFGGPARESPFQNGILPAWPGAGVTSTRSWVMSSIRQDDEPSKKTSPTRDS